MALIKCPECGKEISDKAEHCIYCGYPLPKINTVCNVNGVSYNLVKWKELIDRRPDITRDERWELARELRSDVGGNIGVADTILMRLIETGEIPAEYEPPIRRAPTKPPTPTCPKCGSTSITSSARGVNFTWGLIGASKTVNRCGNCGYTWRPKGR